MKLPKLNLHIHSTYSDGKNKINWILNFRWQKKYMLSLDKYEVAITILQ